MKRSDTHCCQHLLRLKSAPDNWLLKNRSSSSQKFRCLWSLLICKCLKTVLNVVWMTHVFKPKAAHWVSCATSQKDTLWVPPVPPWELTITWKHQAPEREGSIKKVEGDQRRTSLPVPEFCLHLPSSSSSLLNCRNWLSDPKFRNDPNVIHVILCLSLH